jgi:nucleoid DNA-binding protein
LNYGLHPRKGLEPKQEYQVEAVEEFVERIKEVRDLAKESLEKSNVLMKNQYDKHKQPAINYQTGDKVYINTEHLPTVRQSKKLDKKFYGPYEIIEKVGQSAYRIKIPASWKVYNVFNEVLLKLYHAPHFPNQTMKEKGTQDEQRRENDSGDYELEQLLDSRISK